MAIASLVNEVQAGLDETRRAIPELLAVYRRGRGRGPAEPAGLVEVQTGPQIGHRRWPAPASRPGWRRGCRCAW